MILADRPQQFVVTVAVLSWGLLLLVFCFSHVALLSILPQGRNPAGGAVGWVLYLVLLTELNDIAQALWGRRFGKRKMTPVISPNKTWEGLLLGMATTIAAAVWLAPLLTPWAGAFAGSSSAGSGPASVWRLRPLIAGLIIAVSGTLGDLAMSAVKRDAGVKDSGKLIPGQGGVLDRIDSLTFSGPAFFYYVYFLPS